MKSRILLVFGTRPEAIKMAPLVLALKNDPRFVPVVCVTGQHRQMLDQVLELFEIKPDYDLNIMTPAQTLTDITCKILQALQPIFTQEQFDLVLVHGDTTTSTATALAAFYHQIPVGHVEAGLRTNQIYSPWPEEMNRQLTGRLATYHFAPTTLSRENLCRENVDPARIFVTGNTVIDALHWVVKRLKEDAGIYRQTAEILCSCGYDLDRLKDGRKAVLITGHRRENFGDGLNALCRALRELCEEFPSVDFIYPLHLNPHVHQAVQNVFPPEKISNMFFLDPLDYLPFVLLMERCSLILTDSGGIQEEAPALGKPVLVMRDTTERPEALEAGTVRLIGMRYEKIVQETRKLLIDNKFYQQMAHAANPYGDGMAVSRIIEILGKLK